MGWRQEVKKLSDKSGQRKKERTDEKAGRVIIPPTSFLPWIDLATYCIGHTLTHMHAQGKRC